MLAVHSSAGIALVLAACAFGQTTVFEWRGASAGEQFAKVVCAAGDLNGDGLGDVVVRSHPPSGNAQLAARSGFDGGVIWSISTPTVGVIPYTLRGPISLGDVNGDAKPDFVVDWWNTQALTAISGADGAVLWFVNPSMIMVALMLDAGPDVNGDGYGDVLILERHVWANWQFAVVRSGATGAQIGASYPIGFLSIQFTGALMPDVSGDGLAEMVFFLFLSSQVSVLSGPAQVPVHTIPTSGSGVTVEIHSLGDVNGDGKAEVAVSRSPPNYTNVYSGQTWGVLFALSSATVVGAGGRCITIGDLTGDGKPELCLESPNPTPGNGGRSFLSGANGAVIANQAYTGGDFGRIYRCPDLTGDSIPELILGEPLDDGAATDAGRMLVISAISLPAAFNVDLGGGCSAAQAPVLTVAPLAFGSNASIAFSGGTPNALGNLAVDIGLDVPTVLPAGCVFHLDLAHLSSWIFIPIGTDPSGAAGLQLGVPTIPLLANAVVTMQVCLLNTPAPLGFDLSNGVRATLGY